MRHTGTERRITLQPRHHRVGLIMAGGLAALVLAAGCAEPTRRSAAESTPSSASPSVDNTTWQTQWGPLSAADRDLIKKVRLASLWEMTMAQEAIERAQSPQVRLISAEIVAQHMVLDRQDRALAAKLNVQLPAKPSDAQQRWMQDIRSQSGDAYDRTYVKWLRFAHGQVFALIGQVRGTTQNTLVRPFSETCNDFVLNHQRLLESTGLTTAESFPTPPPVNK